MSIGKYLQERCKAFSRGIKAASRNGPGHQLPIKSNRQAWIQSRGRERKGGGGSPGLPEVESPLLLQGEINRDC